MRSAVVGGVCLVVGLLVGFLVGVHLTQVPVMDAVVPAAGAHQPLQPNAVAKGVGRA